jgi:tetratricopeptide (TPR) repeat protein
VPERPIVLVSGEAVRAMVEASRRLGERRPAEALAELDRAERLGPGDPAPVFRSTLNGRRALSLAWLGRLDEAVARAQEGLSQWRDNPDAHMALALARADQARLDEAAEHVDSVLAIDPGYPRAAGLRDLLRVERRRALGR